MTYSRVRRIAQSPFAETSEGLPHQTPVPAGLHGPIWAMRILSHTAFCAQELPVHTVEIAEAPQEYACRRLLWKFGASLTPSDHVKRQDPLN